MVNERGKLQPKVNADGVLFIGRHPILPDPRKAPVFDMAPPPFEQAIQRGQRKPWSPEDLAFYEQEKAVFELAAREHARACARAGFNFKHGFMSFPVSQAPRVVEPVSTPTGKVYVGQFDVTSGPPEPPELVLHPTREIEEAQDRALDTWRQALTEQQRRVELAHRALPSVDDLVITAQSFEEPPITLDAAFDEYDRYRSASTFAHKAPGRPQDAPKPAAPPPQAPKPQPAPELPKPEVKKPGRSFR